MGQFPNPNTKWKPGQSGNPSGYSRGRRQIDDMIDMIEETAGAERAISRSWLKQVLAGSYPHLREYLERRDGKVPTPVEAIETPTVDWSELNVDRDTERPKAANTNRPESVPESGIAEL